MEATQSVSEQTTGDPRVDEQLTVLDQLIDLPVTEHVPILENVHRALADILATIDSAGQSVDAAAAEPVTGGQTTSVRSASQSRA